MNYSEFEKTLNKLSDLCLNAKSEEEMEKFSNQITNLRNSNPEYDIQYGERLFSEVDKEYNKITKIKFDPQS